MTHYVDTARAEAEPCEVALFSPVQHDVFETSSIVLRKDFAPSAAREATRRLLDPRPQSTLLRVVYRTELYPGLPKALF